MLLILSDGRLDEEGSDLGEQILENPLLQESVQISNAEYEAFAVGGLLISVQRVKSGKGASKKALQDNVSVDKTGPFF